MSSRIWRSLFSAALLLLAAGPAVVEAEGPGFPPPPRLWEDVELAAFDAGSIGAGVLPGRARTLWLDLAGMRWLLQQAPPEGADANDRRPLLELPLPGGGFEIFRLEETAVLHPELAEKFPEIRTFRGTSTGDAATVAHLDLTEHGFHALVLGPRGALFVDPAQRGDVEHYVAYWKRDYVDDGSRSACGVSEASPVRVKAGDAPLVAGTLRTYRLAVGATGEYTTFHGGTVSAGLAAIATTMTRVNGVYERDFSVRMQLVANNNLIVYTNASTDPYNNTNASTLIGQSQSNADSVIGSANYDIGHVFSTGAGGLAGLGVVCRAGNKARGVTGRASPVGDPYDIDYVAHEMGHQFGGDHTFNGTTSSCSGNRVSSSAYEPGSGSTIMAYAGICGAENLQPNSDDSFHARSLDQMSAYMAGSGACGSTASVTNSAPTVNAGAAYTIPSQTPFTLTATASDVNGDALTYNWEQYSLGTASPPNTDNGTRPIFRSFAITSAPARTFPRLSDILNNVATLGESLPTTTRTMTFRVTARDNHAGGGAYAIGSTTVTSRADSGPFAVTAPNTAVSWAGGSTQTVTWAVANTTAAPVSTANVRVLLSTDGGNSFPTVLLATTPNDGSQTVTVPNTPTTQARVKVEAVGNIYFDISNANFTITGGTPTPDFSIACSPSSVTAAAGGSANTTCTVASTNGFASAVALSCAGAPSGVSCSYAPSSVTPPANGSVNSTLTISVGAGVAPANYTFGARGTSGATVRESAVTLTVTGTGGGAQTASYDATLRVPKCALVGISCDSGASLLLGRSTKGPEPNQPNTINATCADGTSGTFHVDESNDRLKVSTVDGTNLAAGKSVRIDATVWAYSSFTSDKLDLYYAANANSPAWTFVGTLTPTAAGAQTLSATYTLPAGALQAVRAQFRYNGTAGTCTSGGYNDRDDLIFAVQ